MKPETLLAEAIQNLDQAIAAARSADFADALRFVNRARALIRAALSIDRWGS